MILTFNVCRLLLIQFRYHVSLHVPYFFSPMNWHSRERDVSLQFTYKLHRIKFSYIIILLCSKNKCFLFIIQFATLLRIFFKTFHYLQFRPRRPIVMAVVDNYPSKHQSTTNPKDVYDFLE